MDKFDQYKRMLRLGVAGFEILVETVIFTFIWFQLYNVRMERPFENKGNLMMLGFYVLYQAVFVYMYGGTKYAYYKKGQLILSQTLGMLIANGVMYLQIIMVFHVFPFPIIWPIFIACGADFLVIVIVNLISDKAFWRWFPPKRLLLVCDEEHRDNLLLKISSRKDLYVVSGCVSSEAPLVELREAIQDCDAMMIYGLEEQKRNILLKYCYERSIRIYVAPEVTDILLRGADGLHTFDTPFLLLRNHGLSFEQRIMKRVMDLVISAVLLILTLPFMLLTALAIKAEDRGPALFKQERVTLDGKKFQIYKFRSMIVDAEKDGARFSSKNDDRITKVGKFIRATRLDELPQLFNILKGDMSIVGPRPERQQYIEEFCRETPEFIYRLKVKAGLTGYAQIYGKYNTTPLDKLKLDLMYIESYSIWMDIRLIFLTLKIMFMKESTEGVEDGQNHA